MNEYLEINEGQFVHVSMIKRVQNITDDERKSLQGLGKHVDADRFSTRIERPDGTKLYAQETIDEMASQGVPFVQVGDETFVPRNNIIQTKNISAKDRQSFKRSTGRDMPKRFLAQIETKAGKVLSPYEGKTVMKNIGAPYQPQTARPENLGEATKTGNEKPTQQKEPADLSKEKEMVLGRSAPSTKSKSPNKSRTPDVG